MSVFPDSLARATAGSLDERAPGGEQRRDAASLEERELVRLHREIMARAQPDGLREWEVELDRLALTIPPTPVPVTAFVVYPVTGGHLRVPAFATRWTEYAVDVTWATTDDPDGLRHRAWIWRSAVRPRR